MEKQTGETEPVQQITPEMDKMAGQKAIDRSNAARWDLDIAVFLFAVLIIVIILLFEGITIGFVGPVALFGLTMVWLVGWRRGKQLYRRFYDEEINTLRLEVKKTGNEALVNTLEERVQQALRERMR